MIDKRISMSKKIGAISDSAKVLWFMVYPHLDKEGRIRFEDIEDLRDEIIPKFKWGLKKIANTLNELADIKLIVLYPNENSIAMQFEKFKEFQIGLREDREAKSQVPPPSETPAISGNYRITLEDSLLILSLSSRKFKEGTKEEEKNIQAENTGRLFEEFWTSYPKEGRFHKGACASRFASIVKEGRLDDLKAGFAGYLDHLKDERLKGFNKSPMHMMTFLNKERYMTYKDFRYAPKL